MRPKKIVLVDIDPVIRSCICTFLTAQGHEVTDFPSCHDAQSFLQNSRPDAVILDLYVPNGDAPQLLRQVKSLRPVVPVILLSGQATTEAAARAIRLGADQVLVKPVELQELHAAVLHLVAGGKSLPNAGGKTQKPRREYLNPFVGSSAAIHRLREAASRVLPGDSPILLQGETGSGKGVLANWIHRNGARCHQPFLDLNCAGLSRELLESELFGYEQGAFTGAMNSKPGLLEVADKGTVFLDEIGDIDLQVQPKLLKVLEDRMLRRLGDVRDRTVDIRLISATHSDLLELVRQQRFRSDLFFRVNIFLLSVPALRERVEDIGLLSQQMVHTLTRSLGRQLRISPAAVVVLQQYPWPGNIRELRNVLERAAVAAEQGVILPEHLQFQRAAEAQCPSIWDSGGTLDQMERAYISDVLQAEAGSIERTARRLGIPRSSLYNKMKRFEIAQGTGRRATRVAGPGAV